MHPDVNAMSTEEPEPEHQRQRERTQKGAAADYRVHVWTALGLALLGFLYAYSIEVCAFSHVMLRRAFKPTAKVPLICALIHGRCKNLSALLGPMIVRVCKTACFTCTLRLFCAAVCDLTTITAA